MFKSFKIHYSEIKCQVHLTHLKDVWPVDVGISGDPGEDMLERGKCGVKADFMEG